MVVVVAVLAAVMVVVVAAVVAAAVGLIKYVGTEVTLWLDLFWYITGKYVCSVIFKVGEKKTNQK